MLDAIASKKSGAVLGTRSVTDQGAKSGWDFPDREVLTRAGRQNCRPADSARFLLYDCSMPSRKAALALLTLALSASGCSSLVAVMSGGVRKSSVNMEKWELTKMDVSLQGGARSICPRAPVQMSIVAEAKHKKRDKVKTMETWAGDPERAVRIGKMGFESFDFATEGGEVDENGYFHPSPDMLATAGGYKIGTKYKEKPDSLTSDKAYVPTYDCVVAGGMSASSGQSGPGGATGESGASGDSGSSEKAGGPGGTGGAGGQGPNGGDGASGPSLTAYATLVSTEHHDSLVLLRIEGDTTDTLLFDPKSSFVLGARGGMGGAGGPGGSGGSGGRGGSGYLGGDGGAGGPGGSGGLGGNGGAGGKIEFFYDSRYPELANVVALDVAGGGGGNGGSTGSGGSAGSGGSGQGEGSQAGPAGAAGPSGVEGSTGSAGSDGLARAESMDTASVFADLPEGVTLL